MLALPLMMVAAAITGCNEKENAAPANTTDTLIAGKANLSIFKAALKRTGMDSYTKGSGPFTYFIPSDDAFKASGINSVADLAAIDSNLLTQVLAYHIMSGRRTLVEIPSGPNAPATAVGGLSFYASKNIGGTFINGSKLSESDIIGSNGVIHVIDKVLVPPFANLLVNLQANPNFKLFVQGITKAAITATFSGTTVYTVFAPTNAAMIAGGYDSTTIANLSGTALTNFGNVLRYHVVPGRFFSSELRPGNSLKTLQTSNIAISAGPKVKGNTNPAPFNVTATDFTSTNGILHTIDGVLKY